MKINKEWYLQADGYPYDFPIRCAREKFDSVAIIHYPNQWGFTPIVLSEDRVRSEGSWRAKDFYDDLCRLLSLSACEIVSSAYLKGIWYLERLTNSYQWGCRNFKEHQLITIKEAMEEYYTAEQLGKAKDEKCNQPKKKSNKLLRLPRKKQTS